LVQQELAFLMETETQVAHLHLVLIVLPLAVLAAVVAEAAAGQVEQALAET
jgi:hypothetical protein